MPGSSASRSQYVLLVDGDLRSTQRLAGLLREDGFDVEVLSDGLRAVERLAREPLPDTLILELSLPGKDGAAVARFAIGQRSDMRIIVLTRYPNLLGASSFGGASPFVLSKPLDYACLLELLGDTSVPALARPDTLLPGVSGC